MFFKKTKKKRDDAEKELAHQNKVLESQRALLEAATATADIAHVVTTRLKQGLEDSVRQFEATARILNDALVVCGVNGDVQAFNPAAETMFGWSAKEIRSRNVIDLFALDGEPIRHPADLWRMLDGKAGTILGRRNDGVLFEIDHSFDRLDRSDGSTIVLMLVHRHTTDRRARAAAEHHCRSIFETSFDGILIQQNDLIVAMNPAISHLFGYREDELLGKPVNALIQHRDDVAHHQRHKHHTAEGRHQEGYLLDLLFTTTPITWNDAPARLMVIKDVTERRRMEERMIQNFNADMICCVDPDLRITFANESFARAYGKSRADLLGSSILAVLREGEHDPFLLSVRSLTPQQPTRRIQIQTDEDGDTRVYDWTDHAAFDPDGKPVEFQRTGRDITQMVSELLDRCQ